ncbi:MAG: TetR/AcrR family transcriptional regulator [Acidimicrobiales bacterium]
MTARRQVALDRTAILLAALDLVDRKGLSALNMRAVADQLGVGTMSLYHHVGNKDGLLDGLVEVVLGDIDVPEPGSGGWEERAARMARSLRDVALRHPGCVPLLVTRPFATGPSLRPCEAAFDLLAEAGLDTEQALIAFRTMVAYVLGWVMMESSGFFSAGGPHREPTWLEEAGLPRLAAMAAHLDNRDVTADFDAGLRVVELGVLHALLERGASAEYPSAVPG